MRSADQATSRAGNRKVEMVLPDRIELSAEKTLPLALKRGIFGGSVRRDRFHHEYSFNDAVLHRSTFRLDRNPAILVPDWGQDIV